MTGFESSGLNAGYVVQLLEQYSKAFHEYTYLDVRESPSSNGST